MKYVATLPKEAGKVIGACLLGKHVVVACDGGPYILVTKGDQAVFETIQSQYAPASIVNFNALAPINPNEPTEIRVGRPIEWAELAAATWEDSKTLQFDIKQ